MSEWVKMHQPCPCGQSHDAYSVNDKGWGKCFSCQKNFKDGEVMTETSSKTGKDTKPLLPPGEYQDIRGIFAHTCEKFGYTVGTDEKGRPCHIAPYRNENGQIIGQKIRYKGKEFTTRGDTKKAQLFGQHLWSAGGKRLVITEGEIDCLSYSQCTNLSWPTVSVKNGAGSAKRGIMDQLEWVESFEEVVFLMDMDPQGQEAAVEAADLLTPGKAKIATLPLKDANEMLKAGRTKELVTAIYQARVHRPDGIMTGDEIDLQDLMTVITKGYPTPYPIFNEKYHGIRKGELLLLTAGSGVGKSTLAREIAYHFHLQHKLLIGNVYLEESITKTAQGYIAIHNNVALGDLRENPELIPEDMWLKSKGETVDGMMFYKHFGSLESDNLIAKMRYMASSGCDFIVLDHISLVVSGQSSGRDGERKDIDVLMTKLRSMIEQTGVGVIGIVHLNQPEGKPHEEGAQIRLNHLRGSGSLKQLSDGVVALERDQQSEDEGNLSKIRILKNREFGLTGLADTLEYNPKTGRLLPVEPVTTDFDDDGEDPDPDECPF